MELRPVTARTGAVVEGVDLRALDEETLARIHDALVTRGVLFFRDPAETVRSR
jgi:taurine dioxygenase